MNPNSDESPFPGTEHRPLGSSARQYSLRSEDADAVDAILARRMAGVKTGPIPPGGSERAERAAALLSLLNAYPVQDAPDDLVQRTLDRVAAARQRERFQQQVEMLTRPGPSLGLGWGQIAAAAAIFLVAAALLMPVLERNRHESMRAMASANLHTASQGLVSYASVYDGVLPRRQTRPGDPWINVGAPVQAGGFVQSNSANLFQLIRSGFASPEHFNDPANPHAPSHGELTEQAHDWRSPEQVSFSYQNQFGPRAVHINRHPNLVVLATKNPMFIIDKQTGKLTYCPTTPETAASRLHDGRGQHLLFANGAVRWTRRPVVTYTDGREDAIYAAHQQSTYQGNELPASEDDSFLVP